MSLYDWCDVNSIALLRRDGFAEIEEDIRSTDVGKVGSTSPPDCRQRLSTPQDSRKVSAPPCSIRPDTHKLSLVKRIVEGRQGQAPLKIHMEVRGDMLTCNHKHKEHVSLSLVFWLDAGRARGDPGRADARRREDRLRPAAPAKLSGISSKDKPTAPSPRVAP